MTEYKLIGNKQAECGVCHAKMDARGVNGHMRKHGIGMITHRKPRRKTLFQMPSKPAESLIDIYRRGYLDGIADTKRQAA
jgi:hypothetical protein